jgi:tetratricopeptide (TPR) repeat protein/tRNA A-37 threonylcarbamoyl transferase component Bud32
MNLCGISDSVATAVHGPEPCPSCGSTSRVGRGLCLQCLLQTGCEPLENKGNEPSTLLRTSLAQLLDEIDVPDADWRLGNYQILEEIGRGGMGVIYRARQRHSRRIVALKRVLSYHADSRDTLVRFRREAEAAASLDHPNILPIYEVSESEDGLPYFSMKFAPGGSLLEVAPAFREEPRRAAAIMAKVARAVQYAHVQGILHRDLKPGNVLLDARGEPLVSDFGLAKWLDTASDLTRTLTIFGTPGYIAPEQARSPARNLTPSADVYSLGAILFDLLTGRPPFLGEHALAVIQQASEKPAPKLRALAPHLDRDLETICAKSLDRDPSARYRSAGELTEDLERWLEGRPIIARPVSPAVRLWRSAKRNPKLAVSITACLIFGAIAGVFELQNRAASRAAAAAMHSVAVEPFFGLDTADHDGKLAAAIAVALQKELSSQGPAHVVVAASASDGGLTDEPHAIWKGARTALQGTTRLGAGKLRVALRLVSTVDQKLVYRQVIEVNIGEEPAETIATQSARKIYALLNTADISTVELADLDPGWRDAHTRELLVAGKALMDRRTAIDFDRAIELFQKAVTDAPSSSLAYSYLAQAQLTRAGYTGDNDYLSAADRSARTAVQLNPNLAEARKATSMILFQQGHFREALEEAFTAYELMGDDNGTLANRVADNLRILGDPAKAATWYRMAKASRPGSNEFMVADCLSDLTDDENAAAIYRRVWTLFPELPEGWMGLCHLAVLQKDFATARKIAGDNWTRYRDFVFSEEMAAQVEFFSRNFPEAEKLYRDLAARDPDGGGSFYGAVSYQSALGRLRLGAEDVENGTRILQEHLHKELEALASTPQHPEILYRVAAIESCLGRLQPAAAHLQKAAEAGWTDYRSLEIDPRFDGLRETPGYKTIFTAMVTRVTSLRTATAAAQVAKK